jgi:hypothetical protein
MPPSPVLGLADVKESSAPLLVLDIGRDEDYFSRA